MAEEINMISIRCPHCRAIVRVPEVRKSVRCPACDEYFNPVEEKEKANSTNRGSSTKSGNISGFTNSDSSMEGMVSGVIQGIQNAESAYAYACSVYDEMDWQEYQENDYAYRIDSIAQVIDEIRLTCSNNKLTYLLEFDSYVIPYTKKIEGVDNFAKKIVECIEVSNETDANSYFSVREGIVSNIQEDKESILKKLSFDIESYEKYGATKEELELIKQRFEEFKGKLEDLKPANDINDIPGIQTYFDEKDQKVAEKLFVEGIVASQEYERAIELRKEGKINACLNILIKLKGYKDSNIIIAKENEFFDFDEFFMFAGKPYYYKKLAYYKDVIGPNKKVTKELVSETDNLFEIVDKKPGKEPILKDLTLILCRYGTRILYLNVKNEIKLFDFANNEDISIDNTKTFVPKFINKYINKYSSVFAYARTNNDKTTPVIPGANDEFEMAEIRLSDTNPSVDVLFKYSKVEYRAGRIFAYKHKIVVEKGEGRKAEKKVETVSNVYDFETRRTRRFLDKDAHVTHAVGDYLFYIRYKPTPYNLDLYRFDLTKDDEQEEQIIRHNIFDVLDVDENKVFYVVGSEELNTMYSYDIEKDEVIELFKNAKFDFTRSGGYFYVTKGDDYNSFYIKIKEDGSKRILLARDFKINKGIKNGFLYYMDTYDNLKRVRLDGSDEQVLLTNYKEGNVMKITDNRIYCSLHEDVDIVNNKPVQGYSIISFDRYGQEIKKHIFNINNGLFYNDEEIIFSTFIKKQFKIKNPDKDMNPLVYRDVLTYYKENINTHEREVLFSAGLPEGFKQPRGCFKKKKDPLIFEEVEEEREY